jgi:hypothetical protein
LIDLLPPREVLTALGLILTEGPVLAARSGTVFKTNLIALAGRVSLIRDTQVRVGAWADRSIGTGLEPLLARLLALAELDTRAFVDIFRLPAQVIPIVLFLGLDASPGILLPEHFVIVLIAIDQLQILSFLCLAAGNTDAEIIVFVEDDELVIVVGIIRVVRIIRARRIIVLLVMGFLFMMRM